MNRMKTLFQLLRLQGWRALLLATGALLLSALIAGAGFAQEADRVIRFVRNPDAAPDFKLDSIDGRPLTLASARGKVVLLNFWATWCGPCRAEIPDLIALQQKYRDHLVILGISEDEGPVDTVKRFATQQQMNYPIVMSTDAIRQIFKGVVALPTTFVLDRDGRMVQKNVGLLNKSRTEAVTRYLAGMDTTAKIERVEDPTKLDLTNASEIKDIPGVDFSHVPAEQKTLVLQLLNAQGCTCGC